MSDLSRETFEFLLHHGTRWRRFCSLMENKRWYRFGAYLGFGLLAKALSRRDYDESALFTLDMLDGAGAPEWFMDLYRQAEVRSSTVVRLRSERARQIQSGHIRKRASQDPRRDSFLEEIRALSLLD